MANELKPGDVVWISLPREKTGIHTPSPLCVTLIREESRYGRREWRCKETRRPSYTWALDPSWIDWFRTNVYRRRHGK